MNPKQTDGEEKQFDFDPKDVVEFPYVTETGERRVMVCPKAKPGEYQYTLADAEKSFLEK